MNYEYTTPGPYASIVDGTVKQGDTLTINDTLPKYPLYIANLGSTAIIRPSGVMPAAGQAMTIDGTLTINLLTPTGIVNLIQGAGPPAVGNIAANLRIGPQGVIAVNGSGAASRTLFGGATTDIVLQNQGTISISNSSVYGCKIANFVSGIGNAASNPRGKIILKDVTLQGGGKYPFSLLAQTFTFVDLSYQDISMQGSSIYINTISNSTISLSGSNNYIGFGNTTAPGTLSPVRNLVIRGFGAGDILDIPSPTASDTWSYNRSTGILTIQTLYGSRKEISVDIGLGYDPALFAVIPLPSGSTPAGQTKSSGVTYNGPTPCYLPGTLISTPKGDIAIECLSGGDEIHVYVQGQKMVKKLEQVARGTAFARRSLAGQPDLAGYPVRVARGALGDEIPFTDTYVTSEHCLFVEGHLIPARLLVNGQSIAYDLSHETYEFYHLILDEHAIICANGLLSESLYHTHLPDFGRKGARLSAKDSVRERAAPLGVEPSFVRAVSRRLHRPPAEMPRHLIPTDTDFFDAVYLTAGERKIRPLRKKGRNLIFTVPDDVSEITVHTPSLRLCDAVGAYWDDRRVLGMLVGEISLFDSLGHNTLKDHLSSEMRAGWNIHEGQPARWTTGETPLTLPLRVPGSLGILTLEIHDTCYDVVERIIEAETGSRAA